MPGATILHINATDTIIATHNTMPWRQHYNKSTIVPESKAARMVNTFWTEATPPSKNHYVPYSSLHRNPGFTLQQDLVNTIPADNQSEERRETSNQTGTVQCYVIVDKWSINITTWTTHTATSALKMYLPFLISRTNLNLNLMPHISPCINIYVIVNISMSICYILICHCELWTLQLINNQCSVYQIIYWSYYICIFNGFSFLYLAIYICLSY